MRFALMVCAMAALSGCTGEDDDYTALSLVPQGDHFVAQGVIDGTTPKVLRDAFAGHPEIKSIILRFVPGSVDDEANLEASRLIRSGGLKTIVPTGGLVASGGTDMFLAGLAREIRAGACVGVHSWAAGDGTEGKDLPRADAEHRLYLGYYDEMGIAPAFYWFTLDAADADGMHYMSTAEIAQYGIVTRSISGRVEANADRCEAIGAELEPE